MFNNDKNKKSWVSEGMKGVVNKMSNFNKSPQDSKTNPQYIDPAILEEIIKKQLIEKNPKLLADKNLLEETIRKALKNLLPKQTKNQVPIVQSFSQAHKQEIPTVDLLDIGNDFIEEKNENKSGNIEINKENIEEKKNEKLEIAEESFLENKENRQNKVAKIEKTKINEEIKIKYSFLQQNYQFKFESRQEISNSLHKYIIENIEKDEIALDKKFIIKVLENLNYLRKCQAESREQEDKYKKIGTDYNKMQERLTNQENLLKNIEFTYQEKMNGIEYSCQEKLNALLIENKNLKKIIEGNEMKSKIILENFKEETFQNQEKIKKYQNDLEIERQRNEKNEKEINIFQDSITHLKKEIENYKKIKRNEKLDCHYQSQNLICEGTQSLKLENFIPTKIIYNIMEFLPPQDIIVFRSLNKLSYNCMSFDYRFYSLLLKKIRFQQKTKINSLHKKLDYFKNLAEKIPDEYLKASLIKFISLQEKFGEYIPAILHKSRKVFENLEEANEIININPLTKPFNNQINSNNNEEDLKKKGSTSFGGNLFKKMMGLNKTANVLEEKPKFEKNNIQDINILVGKLLPESNLSIDIDFLKQIESDRNQIIKQAYEKSEEFMKILFNKGIQLSNNMQKMGLFIESLQRNFCFLFVFCSVLLQEGKEIENLKNFLMSHILQLSNELKQFKNQNDDNNELFSSQKKMKEFLAAKNKELEKRVHEANYEIVKSKEEILNLSSSSKKLKELCQNLTKEKSELENKMKLLSREVKFSRAKNNEYENDLKKIVDNCLDIKFLFENLRLDV